MEEYMVLGGIKYQLNKSDHTAAIQNDFGASGHIIIPRSITYDSDEYIITSISSYSLANNNKILSIQFDKDSQIRTIELGAFTNSSLNRISFPASIENLKGFADSSQINYVSISPQNKNFIVIDNSFIIGKSDPKSDIFDSLIFMSRNKQKVTIQPFIKYICSGSFANCNNLKEVEFTEDSQLLKIESNSFSFSSIEKINLPPKLEQLQEGWCNYTSKLNSVIISPENKNFCYLDDEKKIILGKSNIDQDFFDVIVFGSRDLTEFVIPKYIKKIGSGAFSDSDLEFFFGMPKDSELESFGSQSFFRTNISCIFIPKHVKVIDDSAFNDCRLLEFVVFDEDSELEIIGESAFAGSYLGGDEIKIPCHVKEIKQFAFNLCGDLKSVLFDENAEVESFGEFSFAYTNLLSIVIPKSVKVISNDAFNCCNQLRNVIFQEGSQLELIADGSFAETKIEQITIPKHVKKIGKKAFYLCRELIEIKFEKGSEIHTICKNAFQNSSLSYIEFPDSLVNLEEGWCRGTESLTTIVVSPNNKNFCFFNEEMLLKKSDENDSAYDTIIFISRDVEDLNFPSFIKYITPYAFSDMIDFLDLTFPEDSELVSIDKNAFFSSGVESIHLPERIVELKDGWCISAIFLVNITISPKNKNFTFLPDQKKVMIAKSNNNEEIFDVITLAFRDIKKVFIPNYIKYINSGAFGCCENLEFIEFENNSKLQYMGENCFSRTSITNICIPNGVKSVGNNSFTFCNLLYCLEGLSDVFYFGEFLFNNCYNLSILSFPNAIRLHSIKNVLSIISSPKLIIFYVHAYSIID